MRHRTAAIVRWVFIQREFECWLQPIRAIQFAAVRCIIVWRKDLGWFIEKYDTWSRYAPETQGVLIVYASMYGNTENAAHPSGGVMPLYFLRNYGVLLAVSVVCCTPLIEKL